MITYTGTTGDSRQKEPLWPSEMSVSLERLVAEGILVFSQLGSCSSITNK